MLAWLTRHETIVTLAAIGGVFSVLSWGIASRRAGGAVLARWCNAAAYGFMGTSVVLFIVAGFLR